LIWNPTSGQPFFLSDHVHPNRQKPAKTVFR